MTPLVMEQDMTERTAAGPVHQILRGLTGGMCVETEDGWCEAATVRTGMRLHTFDGALRPVRRIERTRSGPNCAG